MKRDAISQAELAAFALEGAKQTLERIYAAFPQLREGGNGTRGGRINTTAPTSEARTRKPMSAARKKALSRAMTARWAERRAAAAGKAAKGAKR